MLNYFDILYFSELIEFKARNTKSFCWYCNKPYN